MTMTNIPENDSLVLKLEVATDAKPEDFRAAFKVAFANLSKEQMKSIYEAMKQEVSERNLARNNRAIAVKITADGRKTSI